MKDALLYGYMAKEAVAGVATAAKKIKDKGATGILKNLTGSTKDIVNIIRSLGAVAGETVKTVAPYALIAPPILGAATGYGISQMTAPTGEDKQEAMMHLEEQALEQFNADMQRMQKARKILKNKVLPQQNTLDSKEREIRL